MSSRFSLLLSLVLLLAVPTACGFSPVYGKKEEGQASLSEIQIDPIPQHTGQLLKGYMEDEISEFTAPYYGLHIDYNLQAIPVVTQVEGVAKRYRLVLRANLVLRDLDNQNILLKDTVTRQSSYNISDSDYSTFIAQRSAEEMALQELAHDIILRLSLFMETVKPHENPSASH